MNTSSLKAAIWLLVAAVLAATPCLGNTVPNPVWGNYPQATTPSATGFGIDDWNKTTLVPYPVQYYTFCPWVGLAQPGSAFATWTFNFVGGGANQIPQSDLGVNIYSAWAVINDPMTGLNGTQYARPPNNNATRADAGGADFELTYTPNAAGGTPGDPRGISFLQVYRERFCNSTNDLTCTWSAYSYFFDTSSRTSPFYAGVGGTGVTMGVGGSPVTNPAAQWMLDIPYDCENSGTPNAPALNLVNSPSCRGGTDGAVLATDVQFQTFPATFVGTTVTIYRGLQWGYFYSNADPVPEPGSILLFGSGVVGLVGVVRRKLMQ